MRTRVLKGLLITAALGVALLALKGMPFRPGRTTPAPKGVKPEVRSAESFPMNRTSADEHQLKVLGLALKKMPGHTPVLLEMAQLESQKGQYQDAKRHLQEILDKEPKNAAAKLELGRVLFQIGDVQGAIKQTAELLQANPSNPDALYNMGAIYGNLGNRVRAIQYWKQLVAVAPDSPSGRSNA
jgi:Flp pilus assembly protein TadD